MYDLFQGRCFHKEIGLREAGMSNCGTNKTTSLVHQPFTLGVGQRKRSGELGSTFVCSAGMSVEPIRFE